MNSFLNNTCDPQKYVPQQHTLNNCVHQISTEVRCDVESREGISEHESGVGTSRTIPREDLNQLTSEQLQQTSSVRRYIGILTNSAAGSRSVKANSTTRGHNHNLTAQIRVYDLSKESSIRKRRKYEAAGWDKDSIFRKTCCKSKHVFENSMQISCLR